MSHFAPRSGAAFSRAKLFALRVIRLNAEILGGVSAQIKMSL